MRSRYYLFELEKRIPRDVVRASDGQDSAYLFQFGSYGEVRLLAIAGSLEQALEECGWWLLDHARGHITPHSEPWDADSLDADGNPVDHTYTEAGWIASWEWYVRDYDLAMAERWEALLAARDERLVAEGDES